jgi:hypothetical protein
MTCKGICMRHKASCRYATGNKRCQVCEIFIKWDALFCPCCGYRLRNGPRSMKFKAKLRTKQKENQILVDELIENDQIKSKLVQPNFDFRSK